MAEGKLKLTKESSKDNDGLMRQLEEYKKENEDLKKQLELTRKRSDELKKQSEQMSKENSMNFERIQEELLAIKEKMEMQLSQTTNVNVKHGESLSSVQHKTPTYDGKSSWTNYCKQFEVLADANGWNTRDRAAALIASLRGDALDVLQSLTKEDCCNYETIVEHLEKRYSVAHLEEVYRIQLKHRVQRRSENLEEFAAEVNRLAGLSNISVPSDIKERIAKDAFVDGLRDFATQQTVRIARPKTVTAALTIAMEYDATTRASDGNIDYFLVSGTVLEYWREYPILRIRYRILFVIKS